jgi:hypothetical protein
LDYSDSHSIFKFDGKIKIIAVTLLARSHFGEQADRQNGRHGETADRQTGRQTGTLSSKKEGKQIYRQTDKC